MRTRRATLSDLQFRLAINVRRIRRLEKFTIKVASRRAGIAWTDWLKIEWGRGAATLTTLGKLCAALRVDDVRALLLPFGGGR